MASGDATPHRGNFLSQSHALVRLAFGIPILILCGAALVGFLAGRSWLRDDDAVLSTHTLSRQCVVTLLRLQTLEDDRQAGAAGPAAAHGADLTFARQRFVEAMRRLQAMAEPSPQWRQALAGVDQITATWRCPVQSGHPLPAIEAPTAATNGSGQQVRAVAPQAGLTSPSAAVPTDAQLQAVRRSILVLQMQLQGELTVPAQWEKQRAAFLAYMLAVLSLLSGVSLAGAWIYARQRLRNEQRTQRELELLQQRYVLILNSIGEAICGVDREGIITFVNPAASVVTGWKLEDLLGRSLIDFLHVRSFHSVAPSSAVLDSIRDGVVQRVSTEIFEQPDGGLIPIEFISTPMRDGGEINGAVVAFQDITERRRIERMKGEFMAVVSHELRTPLTSLRGALGLLGSGRMGQIPEPGNRMLSIALANAERLGRLVNDILDLERLNAGRFQLDRTTQNFADVMHQAMDVVRPVADRAQVRMQFSPIDIQVWFDSDRILQTLINLLGNAVKFSAAGSTVWLEAKAQNSFVLISVRDQGRGVPADKLEAIFEQFEQVDASDSREKGGTGLGLPICRGIIQQHGGRIWAESILGKGSTFSFTLPLIPDEQGYSLGAAHPHDSVSAGRS